MSSERESSEEHGQIGARPEVAGWADCGGVIEAGHHTPRVWGLIPPSGLWGIVADMESGTAHRPQSGDTVRHDSSSAGAFSTARLQAQHLIVPLGREDERREKEGEDSTQVACQRGWRDCAPLRPTVYSRPLEFASSLVHSTADRNAISHGSEHGRVATEGEQPNAEAARTCERNQPLG